jgi:hypothetical protein
MMRVACLVSLALACGPGSRGGPTINNKIAGSEETPRTSPVVSSDILAREPVTNRANVKHILIGFKGAGEEDRLDPRAQQRSKAEAEELVRTILGELKSGADFDAMMRKYSEDPGSSGSARPYEVKPDAQLVIEFKQLGYRLRVDEVGVVESEYGFHLMKRVD